MVERGGNFVEAVPERPLIGIKNDVRVHGQLVQPTTTRQFVRSGYGFRIRARARIRVTVRVRLGFRVRVRVRGRLE